jgi:PAS domain-containing protein
MHTVFSAIMGVFLHLINGVSSLSHWLAFVAHRARDTNDYTLAAIVVSSLIMGIACAAWALLGRWRAAAVQDVMCERLERAQEEIRTREALIAACPEAIAVLGADMTAPVSYRGGGALLQACLAGSDAALLAAKLDTLIREGTAFAVSVRTSCHPDVAVRGRIVGGHATIFLRLDDPSMNCEVDYRTILDSLPVPIWLRNRESALTWANRAYVKAAACNTLKDAIASDAALAPSERDLIREAMAGNGIVNARYSALIKGQHRDLAVDIRGMPNANTIGIAFDVTQATQAEGMFRINAEAIADVMDRIETAVAVFGQDTRLVTYNSAYARMWGLTAEWLDTHPSYSEVLDCLREQRRLPEQRDFGAWKLGQLRLFAKPDAFECETWHLPMAASVRVKVYPYLPGGIIFLFEDITEKLGLLVSYKLLAQMQRATLNTVSDGMAVFGPDGRLKLYNDAFARLWHLDESELADEPHITKVADLCVSRTGHDGIWNIVLEGANSAEPARYSEWGTVTRADGRILSLTLSRIPQGATLVVFADLTDIKRFEAEISGKTSTAV